MLEADASITQMAMNHGQRFTQQGDSRAYAEFSMHPRLNEKKSKESGRPIYEEVPYVRIMTAGDKDNIIHRPVRDSDKERFPRQWQAFMNKEEQVQEGTPLAEWAGISRSQVEELAHYGIKTVEALATMPDSANQNFMAIGALKAKAKIYVEDSKLMAPIERLNKENVDLRAEIETLKAMVANQAQPKAEAEPKSTRRSRRKVEADDGEIQDS